MVSMSADQEITIGERNVIFQYIVEHYKCREEHTTVVKTVSKRRAKDRPPEPVKDPTPTITYYMRLEDAMHLARQSRIMDPKLGRLERELRGRTSYNEEIGRATFVNSLEKLGCFHPVFDYCQRNKA